MNTLKQKKQKRLVIATIIFFLIVNTTYYWEAIMGIFAIPFYLLLILYFLTLVVLLLLQIYLSIKEKFKNSPRIILTVLMTTVLTLSYFYPFGFINFENYESESIFIAQREGAANCTKILKLREDKSFVEKNVCFGITKITGTYKIKGDTIFFEDISLGRFESNFYKFAVIQSNDTNNNNYLGDLVRYKEYSNSSGESLRIIKNDLKKLQSKK